MPKPLVRPKPIERFPIKPRKDGRFQKRIHGRLYYFGQNGDRDAAIRIYDRVKNDLYTGRVTPKWDAAGDDQLVLLKHVAKAFVDEEWADVQAGRMSRGNYDQYARAVERFLKFIGSDRVIADVRPDTFSAYARHLTSLNFAGNTFNRERAALAKMFTWATENGYFERPIVLGRGFRRIPKGTIRGKRSFSMVLPGALREVIAAAGPQMRAMILLGMNAGMGAADCAQLRWSAIERVNVPATETARRRVRVIRDR
ncbi:MAG TPA: site-specific integrase, partial [Tepidisphaeraceae bacterium]|nr:site-specific integrase [Tepidisphaeraceae bacterium]